MITEEAICRAVTALIDVACFLGAYAIARTIMPDDWALGCAIVLALGGEAPKEPRS